MGIFTVYILFCLFTFSYMVKNYFFDLSGLDQHIRMGLDMEESVSEFSDNQYKIAIIIGYVVLFTASPFILIKLNGN